MAAPERVQRRAPAVAAAALGLPCAHGQQVQHHAGARLAAGLAILASGGCAVVQRMRGRAPVAVAGVSCCQYWRRFLAAPSAQQADDSALVGDVSMMTSWRRGAGVFEQN